MDGREHFDPNVMTSQLVLDRLLAVARTHLSNEVLRDRLQLHVFLEQRMQRTVLQLETYVLAHKTEAKTLRETRDVWVPANWWQHLRHRVLDERGRLDRWILRRWPIAHRYISVELVVDVERWATFPNAEPKVYPKELGPVVFQQMATARYDAP